MALYKRGNVWWMSFSNKGKQERFSAETSNKKIAETIHAKVSTEITEGRWFDKPKGTEKTFSELMKRYMEEHSRPNKKSSERDHNSLKHLLPFFGDYALAEISPKLINLYKTDRRKKEASPCTVNRELALMKHAFNLALREWEWIKDNPVKRVSMEKEPPARDRWLKYDEEKELLKQSEDWLEDIIIFAIETGCRQGEILSLAWKDVDLFRKTVNIFGSKTEERRTIPLSIRAFDLLKKKSKGRIHSINLLVFSYPHGNKVNRHTLRDAYKRARKGAGIEDFRFHDLRHIPLQQG